MNSATCTIDDSVTSKSILQSGTEADATALSSIAVGTTTTLSRISSASSTTWWKDYVELTKPRILMMILITVGAGAVCVPSFTLNMDSSLMLLGTLVGTMFVAASASILNQVIEKHSDAAMKRTRNRPLPSGRLTEFEASGFGMITAVFGLAILAATTNATATLVAFMTWLLYVGVYTPMKMTSVWNTAVGTLPGAMPVLIGWCGLGGSLSDYRVWAIAGIVVLWQFPHFMSIAWLYRKDYANAGYKMWTTEEASGYVAGIHAWLGAAALIVVSVVAMWSQHWFGWILVAASVLVGLQQLVASIRFHRDRNDMTARKLLHSSLIVLPMLMACAVLQSFFG